MGGVHVYVFFFEIRLRLKGLKTVIFTRLIQFGIFTVLCSLILVDRIMSFNTRFYCLYIFITLIFSFLVYCWDARMLT
jgi:hypothetical protein